MAMNNWLPPKSSASASFSQEQQDQVPTLHTPPKQTISHPPHTQTPQSHLIQLHLHTPTTPTPPPPPTHLTTPPPLQVRRTFKTRSGSTACSDSYDLKGTADDKTSHCTHYTLYSLYTVLAHCTHTLYCTTERYSRRQDVTLHSLCTHCALPMYDLKGTADDKTLIPSTPLTIPHHTTLYISHYP
jgi:hypothetical protein